jgi:hypothetical protein
LAALFLAPSRFLGDIHNPDTFAFPNESRWGGVHSLWISLGT